MIINGKIYWAKVLGEPIQSNFDDYREWSFDLTLDDTAMKTLADAGMDPAVVRNNDDERGNFITFRRREFRKDGTAGRPFSIVDRNTQPWDPKVRIGNGTVANVIMALNVRTIKRVEVLRPSAKSIQIVHLVKYLGGDTFDDLGDDVFDDDTGEQPNW